MAMSDPSHRPWVLHQLRDACGGDLGRIRSAVDAGAGLGGWKEFCGPWFGDCRWTAVEIHQPYVDRFIMQYRYANVLVCDLRDLDPFPPADVVFFGDVLEHMPADDAVKVWDRAREVSWRLVLGIPVREYPQGESLGNPHEAHLATWYTPTVLASFTGIYAHAENADTGAFIAEGKMSLG